MASRRVMVKNNVRDPQSYQLFTRGVYEVSEVRAASLLSMGEENVVSGDDIFEDNANKAEMVEAARAVGIEVEETDTKEDVRGKMDERVEVSMGSDDVLPEAPSAEGDDEADDQPAA